MTGKGRSTDQRFYPPVRGPDLVVRQRLLDTLTLASRMPVTLVVAAAGSGKTHLLANWFSSAEYPGPIAWVTLEVSNDRPTAFWASVIGALEEIGVLPADSIDADTVGTGDQYALRELGVTLASQPVPVILVLDQAESLASNTLGRGLDQLLTQSAGNLRLVIASRVHPALPLHRYRLDDTLFEVRGADLAFTRAEVGELAVASGVNVLHPSLSALTDATEGWVAGVRLGLLALRDSQVVGRSPTRGWPHTESGYIAEYLKAEVVDTQDADVRDLLLRTSFLERVWPDLADTLTGRPDGHRILDSLARANAFVGRQDGDPASYRYHPLLRAVLQADLHNDPAIPISRLRRAAVEWLRAHCRYDEAVRLAITAADWSAAASIIVHDLAITRLLVRPNGHVDAVLPPASSWTRANPQASLACAVAALASSDLEAAKAHLARAREVKRHVTSGRPAIELCTAVVEIALAHAHENWADVLAAVDEAQKLLAEQSPIWRTRVNELHALVLWHKGVALLWSGSDPGAGAECLRSAAMAAESGNFVPVSMNCLGLLALLEILEGNLQRAERLAATVGRMAHELDGPDEFHPAAADVALAWVKAQQSDLPAARRYADRAARSLSECHDRIAAAVLAVVKARLQAGQHQVGSGNIRSAPGALELSEPLPSWLTSRLTAARRHLRPPSVAKLPSIPRLPHADRIHPCANCVAGGPARPAAAPAMRGRRAVYVDAATDDIPAAARPGESQDEEKAALGSAIIEPLTDREMEVLEKLSAHYSTEEIAEAMFISVNTVRTHVRNILRKLSAPRRQQAVRVARQLRLIA